jgi:hypothetical protein
MGPGPPPGRTSPAAVKLQKFVQDMTQKEFGHSKAAMNLYTLLIFEKKLMHMHHLQVHVLLAIINSSANMHAEYVINHPTRLRATNSDAPSGLDDISFHTLFQLQYYLYAC